MEHLFGLMLGSLLVAFCSLVFLLVKEIQKQPTQSKRSKKQLTQSSRMFKQSRRSIPINLEQKLLVMVGGNRATARRLVNGIRRTHPKRSHVWHWEKAIADLERDRR